MRGWILMGCLIYIAEQGKFTVNEQYPNGAYLRPNDDQTSTKVSNIFSAVQGIYWAIGTFCGNGNINPTTDLGKAFQCILGLSGVLGVSVPVGVIGSELDRAYTKHFKRLKKASDEKEKRRLAEAAAVAVAAATAARPLDGRTRTGKSGKSSAIRTAVSGFGRFSSKSSVPMDDLEIVRQQAARQKRRARMFNKVPLAPIYALSSHYLAPI